MRYYRMYECCLLVENAWISIVDSRHIEGFKGAMMCR